MEAALNWWFNNIVKTRPLPTTKISSSAGKSMKELAISAGHLSDDQVLTTKNQKNTLSKLEYIEIEQEYFLSIGETWGKDKEAQLNFLHESIESFESKIKKNNDIIKSSEIKSAPGQSLDETGHAYLTRLTDEVARRELALKALNTFFRQAQFDTSFKKLSTYVRSLNNYKINYADPSIAYDNFPPKIEYIISTASLAFEARQHLKRLNALIDKRSSEEIDRHEIDSSEILQSLKIFQPSIDSILKTLVKFLHEVGYDPLEENQILWTKEIQNILDDETQSMEQKEIFSKLENIGSDPKKFYEIGENWNKTKQIELTVISHFRQGQDTDSQISDINEEIREERDEETRILNLTTKALETLWEQAPFDKSLRDFAQATENLPTTYKDKYNPYLLEIGERRNKIESLLSIATSAFGARKLLQKFDKHIDDEEPEQDELVGAANKSGTLQQSIVAFGPMIDQTLKMSVKLLRDIGHDFREERSHLWIKEIHSILEDEKEGSVFLAKKKSVRSFNE
jgi:hypothetical protein